MKLKSMSGREKQNVEERERERERERESSNKVREERKKIQKMEEV